MEKIKKFSILQNLSCITLCMYFILMALFPLISCSDSDMLIADKQQNDPETYTYELHLNIDKPTFEGEHTRGTTDWKDGSVVDLYFYTRPPVSSLVFRDEYHGISGTATYNSNLHIWNLETTEDLASQVRTMDECEVRYYEPQTDSSNKFLTAVFYGTTTYLLENDKLWCAPVILQPVNWRIRFHGDVSEQLNLIIPEDIWHATGAHIYGVGYDEVSRPDTFSITVLADGYTPYIYGSFESTFSESSIIVESRGNTYSRIISGEYLHVGESGVIEVPTESNYQDEGWTIIRNDVPKDDDNHTPDTPY